MAPTQQPTNRTDEEVQDQDNHSEVMDRIAFLLEGFEGMYSLFSLYS